jgi:hypothetical protein
MKRMRVRRAMLPLAIGLALIGCRESIGDNIPREEAINRPWHYPVYDMTPSPAQQPGIVVHADGRTWHAHDAPHRAYGAGFGVEIPQRLLRQVGTADGIALYALATDASPFARLYSPLGPDRWRVYLPATF